MHAQESHIQEHDAINSDPFILSPSNMCADIFQEIKTSTCMVLQIKHMTNNACGTPPKPVLAINEGHYVLPTQCHTKTAKARNDNFFVRTNHINPINGGHQVLPAQHQFLKKNLFSN